MWNWSASFYLINNMFTGIINGVARVVDFKVERQRQYLFISPEKSLNKVKLGGSTAINGVCLTVARRTKTSLAFEVMPETLGKTNLGELKKNHFVNVEPALRVGDELGGHLVQGHVDAVGKIRRISSDQENILVEIELPKDLHAYTVLHGSVTLDGISLTIARKGKTTITVSLIAETLKRTIWKNISVGQKVNIEVDVIGKYVKNFLK